MASSTPRSNVPATSMNFPRSQERASARSARNRRPISCLPCRHRKLKCDRALPACGNCVNREDITACCYVARKPETRSTPQELLDLPDSSQARIDRLEQLVHKLLQNGQSLSHQITPPSTNADSEENTYEVGVDGDQHENQITTILARPGAVINISSDSKERHSVNEAHWALLLNQIDEVRSHLLTQHKHYEAQNQKISQFARRAEDPGPTLLFGSNRSLNRSELLSQIPPRYSCDIMVSRFWIHLYPAMHILHQPTFHHQYERFWNDEISTPTAWLALLYAILRVAMLDYIRDGDEPLEFQGKCQDLADTFRNRLTDCLILADYTRPQDFLIEALCFHLYGEYVSSRDAKSSTWVLSGTIVRLAMRMGYHQKSQPTLSSSPFQVELHRRIWAHIRSADIMLSFQLGLPSMISLQSLGDPFPRNIHDQDFNEDSTVIPPPLPDSELTQVSYLIAKSKLVFAFARVLEEISRSETMRWERVLDIDRELRQVYNNVPEHFKLGQLSGPDSLVLVSARFTLSSIHHKALCVLHSRFIDSKSTDDRFAYSRRVCLTSAMTILRFQAIQNQKIPVDNHLRSLTNYQTSLAIHDYLLAAAIITTDLCSGRHTGQQVVQGVPTRMEMIKALDLSSWIFSQVRDQSLEAYKAADVLKMLVKKFAAEKVFDPKDTRCLPNSNTPISSRQQTTSRDVSMNDSISFNDFNASAIEFRPPANLSRAPSRVPRNSRTTYSRGLLHEQFHDSSSADIHSSCHDEDAGFCTQNPILPRPLSVMDSSASMIPEVPPLPMLDRNSDDTDTMFYQSPLAVNDPMSTLWSLSL